MIPRITAYLRALPLPPEGPDRDRVQVVQALIAAGLPAPGLARCWAESCGGRVDHARRLLSGALPWPTKGRKRGKLVRAVEEWEAKQRPISQMVGCNAMSVLCDVLAQEEGEIR